MSVRVRFEVVVAVLWYMVLPSGKDITDVKEDPVASLFMVQDGGSNFL